MKKTTLFLLLSVLWISQNMAQERPCTLITNDGESVSGFVSNNAWVFNNNFKFYDAEKNFQKIKAKDYKSMVVDTTQYTVFKNKEGKMMFMREVIGEGRARLFVHESVVMFEMSQMTVWDYYLVKNDNAYYINASKLKHYPERYFGGVKELTDEIRNTKRKHQKEKIREWVQFYNRAMAQTSESER